MLTLILSLCAGCVEVYDGARIEANISVLGINRDELVVPTPGLSPGDPGYFSHYELHANILGMGTIRLQSFLVQPSLLTLHPCSQYEEDLYCMDANDSPCDPYINMFRFKSHEDIFVAVSVAPTVEDASGVETREFYCEGQRVTDVPACPDSPDGELICVSGWAKYLMDPANPCNIMETAISFGPDATQLEVAVYDPLSYANDPSTSPLGRAEVDPVTSTWKVENIEVPATNFIAVVVRSIDPATDFIFTGFPYEAAPGVNIPEINAYGVTSDQNDAWSTSIGDTALQGAGCDAGDTLFDCGTWVGVFGYEQDNGSVNFLEGVVPRNGAGTPMPEIPVTNAFFLDDTCDDFVQPASLAESYTGSTGVVFMPGANLSFFMGTCADLDPDTECETESYTFEARLGGAAKQAIFVQLEYPEGLK